MNECPLVDAAFNALNDRFWVVGDEPRPYRQASAIMHNRACAQSPSYKIVLSSGKPTPSDVYTSLKSNGSGRR